MPSTATTANSSSVIYATRQYQVWTTSSIARPSAIMSQSIGQTSERRSAVHSFELELAEALGTFPKQPIEKIREENDEY